jgi:nickel superoxide dismutase
MKQSIMVYMGMVIILVLFSLINVAEVFAHCQIPCGIYNDELRFQLLEEDFTTIEKSMQEIVRLSQENPVNYNQLVRWITNKEEHANKIQEIVNFYFLTQRIKPVESTDQKAYQEYTHKLSLLHQLLVYAMKAKQTTDLANVEKLRSLLKEFHEAYFGPEDIEHLKEHHQ